MKINVEKIEKEIASLQKKTQANEKVEIIFTTSKDESEVLFNGHVWGSNCWYSIEDLRKNGDFQIVVSPDGDYATAGIEVSLTQKELETLWKISNKIEFSRAAAALGRKGGSKTSDAKKKAGAANMAKARAALEEKKKK